MLSGESKSRKDAVWKVLDDDRPGNDPRYANKFPIRAAARFPSSFVPRPFDERARFASSPQFVRIGFAESPAHLVCIRRCNEDFLNVSPSIYV